jgi:hypothetical protein
MSEQGVAPTRPEEVSPEEYRVFIKQLELTSVWLAGCRVENSLGPDPPLEAQVEVTNTFEWQPRPEGFDAFARYLGRILAPSGQPGAEVEARYGLRFRSEMPLDDRLFGLFQRVNLPVNAWPYFREFLSTTLGRLGWSPYTLPTLKRGT